MPRGPTSLPVLSDCLHSLVPLLYAAGVEPKRWHRVLACLRNAIHADYCELLIAPSAGATPSMHFRSGARCRGGWRRTGHRGAGHGLGLDHAHQASVSIPVRGSETRALLRALRERREPRFGDAERGYLRRISRHVGRSLELFVRLQQAEARKSAMRAVMNALPIGVLWVDATGRLLETNEAGNDILKTGEGVRVREGRVELSDPQESQQLLHALKDPDGHEESDRAAAARRGFRTSRAGGRVPLYVRVVRLGTFSQDEPTAFIAVSDPERPWPLPVEQLIEQYDLTAAQARVASMLVSGMSVDQIAHQTGRSPSTIRTELKQVFARTGARRQPELVRTLLTGPLLFGSRSGRSQARQ